MRKQERTPMHTFSFLRDYTMPVPRFLACLCLHSWSSLEH